MVLLQIFTVIIVIYNVNAANILAVFPTPSYSHHIVYRVYVNALAADKCHDVTVIKPQLLKYVTPPQLSSYCGSIVEIDADMSTQQFKKLVSKSAAFRKRGVVSDTDTVTAANYRGLIEMFKDQFDNVNVRNLIGNRSQTFDLVVVEAFADYALVFGHLYAPAPVIQIAPGYGLAENFDTVGAVARHPVHHPNIWRSNFELSHANIMTEVRLYKEFKTLAGYMNTMLKSQFGPATPTIQELRNNVQLLLLNLHPVFDNNRPVPPSVQYLGGGMHLINCPVPKLNNAIEMYMNSAKNGVIYVSFGSSIDTKTFADEFLHMLIDTFKALHDYIILWKIDEAAVKNVTLPANVMTQNWFNQRGVLNHGNVVAFITQGGLQSSDEAVQAGVPMVCLPMMGDQFYHAHKLAQFGVACTLDTVRVTTAELLAAVRKVVSLNVSHYRENIKKLHDIIERDKAAFPPLDKALKFTERLIHYRHDIGRRQLYTLKTTAANLPYSNYYMYKTVFSIVMNHIYNNNNNN
ncbi:egt [Catopsilia pomona nucleopolyhedrovirus]|uniref:Ecdysteroid UDP-glucosyltransferase n=1 Tax=Catopsilia pomona nucleopolyhedrovirus TaxID=1850906 RepID=A0A172WZI7_9ABAC|nr:egt [Catopsilia pomona nucleopolyhedrovirus]ANF29771.1 egt [Catopsilia pomona nucleopolyhedrovirus]